MIRHYLEVISHPDFRVIGFTLKDLIEMRKYLDKRAWSIEDIMRRSNPTQVDSYIEG